MPDSSIDLFNDRINDILNTVNKENKIFYLMGDLNIDFLKSEQHKPTSNFVDTIYSHSVFPVITKPTRVTDTTATLIDHILTNNLDTSVEHRQGILCTSISDHYAIFHIAGNITNIKTTNQSYYKRDMKQQNIRKFIDDCKTTSWDDVLTNTDTQLAYSDFHSKITNIYNMCFPIKKYSKGYCNKKTLAYTVIEKFN
jgi:hypothetical protein